MSNQSTSTPRPKGGAGTVSGVPEKDANRTEDTKPTVHKRVEEHTEAVGKGHEEMVKGKSKDTSEDPRSGILRTSRGSRTTSSGNRVHFADTATSNKEESTSGTGASEPSRHSQASSRRRTKKTETSLTQRDALQDKAAINAIFEHWFNRIYRQKYEKVGKKADGSDIKIIVCERREECYFSQHCTKPTELPKKIRHSDLPKDEIEKIEFLLEKILNNLEKAFDSHHSRELNTYKGMMDEIHQTISDLNVLRHDIQTRQQEERKQKEKELMEQMKKSDQNSLSRPGGNFWFSL